MVFELLPEVQSLSQRNNTSSVHWHGTYLLSKGELETRESSWIFQVFTVCWALEKGHVLPRVCHPSLVRLRSSHAAPGHSLES